jgi:mono/diheme cytochrome c family protein
MSRSVIGVVTVAALGGGIVWLGTHDSTPSAEEQWPLFGQYCIDCHNRDDFTAEIAFDRMSAESIAHEPEIFEAVVRKLRGAQMPPPGALQPDWATRREWVAALEGELDAAALEKPNPGQVALHRLNRTEYANAIADLLALDVDVKALLPKDDESDGFDNVANVLKVSPSFLEQYIAAARIISEMAVGLPNAKRDSRVYYAEPGTNQNYHVAGMPLGTRGGMLVEHFFPADGEYEIDLGGLARARYVEGLDYRHRLIVVLDGKKVFEDEIGGPDDVEAVDLRQAAAVAAINGRFENIRLSVTAGPHKIAATFVARTMSESDAVLQPFIPGGGEVGIIEGEESPLKIERLEINGPFTSSGLSDTPSRTRIFGCRPVTDAADAGRDAGMDARGRATQEQLPIARGRATQGAVAERTCAREILTRLTRRAFRRPVTDADLEIPMQFYEQGRANGDFEAGVRNALMIVLASPEFLYRFTAPPDDAAPSSIYAVDQYGLASRLSFFLWSSLPDDELLGLAERGELDDERVISNQVERMLGDPRATALVTNFAQQWLDIRGIRDIVPDPVLFPEYNPDLGDAFARELELFLASVMLEDHSVLELLDGKHTYLNERLALHYGVAAVRGDSFRRVELADENRWGLFGKGGILMATSYPNRTAPVLRGAWILEAITGTPPASPPPNVEAFPETQAGEQPRTVRERLEMHRSNPSCNGCHGVMDPLGFALENFDAIGAWRVKDREAGAAIDSSGQLADGTVVYGPVDLREALLAEPSQFVQTLTEKLMIYALGRSVEQYDMPAVRRIVRDAAREDYRFSAILAGIAQSEPFRFSTTPAADAVAAQVAAQE